MNDTLTLPMTSQPSRTWLLACSLCLLGSLQALTAAESVAKRPRWQVSAGPSFWFNATLSYSAQPAADPSSAAKADHVYDDGFNKVDSTGNIGDGAGGVLSSRTGYFSFLSNSQVNLSAGSLSWHQLQAAGDYLNSVKPSQKPGLALEARLSLAGPDARHDWGLLIGADSHEMDQKSSGPWSANLRLLTDAYRLGGVIPQNAPYTGHFTPSPGDQRIGDAPTRSISAVSGTISGTQEFNARSTILFLGPWFELNAPDFENAKGEADRWSLLANAGLAVIDTKADFMLVEKLSVTGLVTSPSFSNSASGSLSSAGWFAGLKARRSLSQHWSIIASGDFVHGPKFTLQAAARSALLDSSKLLRAYAGLEYRF
jgi:hypothetical protein